MKRGKIYQIQYFSVTNGPGIRTTVFFKGCPLRCQWCHNPESWMENTQLMHIRCLCVNCGQCIRSCPNGAWQIESGGPKWNMKKCSGCLVCVRKCLHNAIEAIGKDYTVEDILPLLLSDAPYMRASGGGVTASGGEPTCQAYFLMDLFENLHRHGIHTALDTSGYCSSKVFHDILMQTDLVLYDLKHLDSTQHERLTGHKNELILENLRMVINLQKPLRVRIPLIPGANDQKQDISAMCRYLKSLGITQVDVIPYHDYGKAKYAGLFMPPDKYKPYDEDELAQRIAIFEDQGMNTEIF